MGAPELSIVIVNWNTRDLLARCLDSINLHYPGGDVEVIVVDNASTDGSAEMVSAHYSQVRLLANADNRGYAAGNNQGVKEATGDHLLLLNPDTEVGPGSLNAALQCWRRHPEAAAIGARLIGPDQSTQRSVRGFPTPTNLMLELSGISRLNPRLDRYWLRHFDYDREQMAPQPMGTFLLTSRDVWGAVGPFDELFPIFFNEVDWLMRAAKQGRMAWYCPGCQILHVGGASTRQRRREMILESHRSLLRLLDKHFHASRRPLMWPLMGLIRVGCLVRCGMWPA